MNALSDRHLLWMVCWLSHIAVEGGKLVSPTPYLQKLCLRALSSARLYSPFTLMSLQKLQAGPWVHLYADDTISYSSVPSLCATSTPQLSLTSVEHFFCSLHFASMQTRKPRTQLKNNTRPQDFIHLQLLLFSTCRRLKQSPKHFRTYNIDSFNYHAHSTCLSLDFFVGLDLFIAYFVC